MLRLYMDLRLNTNGIVLSVRASPFNVSICTIQFFTAFQASAAIEERNYGLNSKFLDCKLSDRNRQNTKIG
jgi:hypothetical protein